MRTPDSQNHCEPCGFSIVEPAAPGRELRAESDLVWDHLQEVVDPSNSSYSSKRIQECAIRDGVAPERMMAGRVCAAMILNGDCPRHLFINRGRGQRFKLESKTA